MVTDFIVNEAKEAELDSELITSEMKVKALV